MESVKQLQRRYVRLVRTLCREGFLGKQFKHLQKYQTANAPQFILDTVEVFYNTSKPLLLKIESAIEQKLVNEEVKDTVHQLKGGSMSIGAKKVKKACKSFRSCYDERNPEGCLQFLAEVKEEYYTVKNKLQTLFNMQQQIRAAGGSIPIVE